MHIYIYCSLIFVIHQFETEEFVPRKIHTLINGLATGQLKYYLIRSLVSIPDAYFNQILLYKIKLEFVVSESKGLWVILLFLPQNENNIKSLVEFQLFRTF